MQGMPGHISAPVIAAAGIIIGQTADVPGDLLLDPQKQFFVRLIFRIYFFLLLCSH